MKCPADFLYLVEEVVVRARTFQCRESLWQTFDSLSRANGVSLDELIEEAMLAYARARGQLDMPTAPRRQAVDLDATMDRGDEPPPPRGRGGRPPSGAPDVPKKVGTGTMRLSPSPGLGTHSASVPIPAPPPRRSPSVEMPAPPPRRPAGEMQAPRGMGRSNSSGPSGMPTRQPPVRTTTRGLGPGPARGFGGPPPLRPSGMDPSPPMDRAMGASSAEMLTLTYAGRSYSVDKDRFLIGRSKSQADLRLDDANVSRQHAMIERANGAWYVVDLGSTNGVFVSGERVARRALRDGDLIEITTHAITCSIS